MRSFRVTRLERSEAGHFDEERPRSGLLDCACLSHAHYVISGNPVTGFAFVLLILIVIAALYWLGRAFS